MAQSRDLLLSVNIDHVATVRNARGGGHPDIETAARAVLAGGADGITVHLREDRRHIRDEDAQMLSALLREAGKPFNLEMGATQDMVEAALSLRPYSCCIVPENRKELNTERGLDVAAQHEQMGPLVDALKDAGIRVALFIDPYALQLEMAQTLGADAVELHTGPYVDAVNAADHDAAREEFQRLQDAAKEAAQLGLRVHAGHGLSFDTIQAVADIPEIEEMSIGHFLIGEAIFMGLENAVRRMRTLMSKARGAAPVQRVVR